MQLAAELKKQTIVIAGALFLALGNASCSVAAERPAVVASGPVSAVQSLPQIEFIEVNTPSIDGRPKQLIVFVHGTPGSYSAFNSYVHDPVLQDRFHMISVTRAGWLNDDDEKIPSLEVQAQVLEPLLKRDESGIGAILMGHSYGGPVIAKSAMQYPDLVSGLVFVATTGDPELSAPRWYNRFAVALPRFLLGDSLKGANAEILPLRPQLEAMLPLWKTFEFPVLIVQGNKDRLVSPGNARFLAEVMENADVTLVERQEMGHFVLWEEQSMIRDHMLQIFDQPVQLACEPDVAQTAISSTC